IDSGSAVNGDELAWQETTDRDNRDNLCVEQPFLPNCLREIRQSRNIFFPNSERDVNPGPEQMEQNEIRPPLSIGGVAHKRKRRNALILCRHGHQLERDRAYDE